MKYEQTSRDYNRYIAAYYMINPLPEVPRPYLEGWICPKCGLVHSPWVPSCHCSIK